MIKAGLRWLSSPAGCSCAHSKFSVCHVLRSRISDLALCFTEDIRRLQTRLRCPTQGQEMQGTPLCDGDCSDELRNQWNLLARGQSLYIYLYPKTCLVIMISTANINNVYPHTYWICTWGSIEGSWPMQGWHISDTFMMKACCNFPERVPPSQYLRQLVSLATSLRYKSAFLPCRCSRLLPLLGRAAGDARRK